MSSKINFEDIISYEGPIDKINMIVADNIIISNLSIIDKFINLKNLIITNCTMNYDDLVHFDYSKFTKLYSLSLICNSTIKYNFDIDILSNLLSKEIYCNNIELAKAIVWNVINTRLFNNIEYDIIYYKNCEKIIFEYEKNVCEQNYKVESKIPLNENIFKLCLGELKLSYYHLNEFFNLLSEDSNLINHLKDLDFEYSTNIKSTTNIKSNSNMFARYIFSKIKDNKIKVDLSNDTITLDNEPICKLLLFKHNFINNVLLYLNCDTYYIGIIPKNRPYFVIFDDKFYNLVMYWKNICYYIDFANCIIDFKPNITKLCISVNRYIYLAERKVPLHESGEKLLCMQNLPNELTYLKIIFFNQELDNYQHDSYPSNYLIDDNLPSTLKEILLQNISTKMLNNIKKIPYDCVLKFNLLDGKEYEEDY
jgi:hypothetical protein